MVVARHEGIVIHRTFLSHKCFIHAHVPKGVLEVDVHSATPRETTKDGNELLTLVFEGKDSAKHMKRSVKLGDALSFQIDEESVTSLTYSFSSAAKTRMFMPSSWEVSGYRSWDMSQVIHTRRLWGMERKGQAKATIARPTSLPHSHGRQSLKLDKAVRVASFLVDLLSIERLGQGSGVYDVAGGSGHVSYVLEQLGVPCTVVDPRDTVACLPRRDRKRVSKLNLSGPRCRAVRPLRAYFGSNAKVDKEFSGGGDDIRVLACKPAQWEEEEEKLMDCSAIVALHPDEATEYVIDFALEHSKPFVVVPCCAFYRLRKTPESTSTVDEKKSRSYVEFLRSKSEFISQADLGFEGASTVLCFVL